MGRPSAKHIDDEELNALVPPASETGHEACGIPADVLSGAERHVAFCPDCSQKVMKYRLIVNRSSNALTGVAQGETVCPIDVDWYEVATGLWPEMKAKQLISHAAFCDHCGPLLRAAARLNVEPTPQEERFLAELKAPSRPDAAREPDRQSWPLMRWLVPALALLAIVGVWGGMSSSSRRSLSGPGLSEFAVNTHREHVQGRLALDVRSDSQQTINDWFKANLPFALALPAAPPVPGEERPYRLEGARMVPVRGQSAAFIAYQVLTPATNGAGKQMAAASLMVVPDSLAVASGGTEVAYRKVSFHYAVVQRYKVVTWSQHGLTYALVSEEGPRTQGSCMVCHSAMRDRDLSQTTTPLQPESAVEPMLQ